ncbi:hypothetical protein [Paraburkholderia franconis]|uniref:hypothetical protein n=1 Tax=Paraburkholderia franconis TaxID=2654983 RepID=UPI00187B6B20|nr:hypothetical protein [Paraburkholderia franconis]
MKMRSHASVQPQRTKKPPRGSAPQPKRSPAHPGLRFMADPRHDKLSAETTGIRLRAGLLSMELRRCECIAGVPSMVPRCSAVMPPARLFVPIEPVRFEYHAARSRSDLRGFPYPFFLDSVRCHA